MAGGAQMSNISSILATIAGLAPAAGDYTPTVYDIDETPDGVDSADCPCRIILPSDEQQPAEFTFSTLGQSNQIEWYISDLMLYAPCVEGTGWRQIGDDLATYCGAYATALIAVRETPLGDSYNSMVIDVSMRRGVYEYPRGTGRAYYGVMVTLHIREFS